MNRVAKEAYKSYSDQNAAQAKTNIFQAILSSPLEPSEKTVDRLAQEGLTLIAAGGETVSRVLCAATYHIISNVHIAERLRAELDQAFGRPPAVFGLSELESLPLLVRSEFRISQSTSKRNS